MKSVLIFTIIGCILSYSSAVVASEPVFDVEILAERGKGVITQDQFAARADRIPEERRKETLRDQTRFEELLKSMMLASQLAADAREAGFDKEKIVIDRMNVAADNELADAWLEHYIKQQPEADFEALAYEYYLVNKNRIMTSEKIDVRHILVSTKERSDDDAKQLADTIHQKVLANPAVFDELVVEYSEDPGAAANKGKYKNVKKGDMVKPFEEAAFSLKPGEISEPVKSKYGYHIIRLDSYIEPEPMPFDSVKQKLITYEQQRHVARIKRDYLESLTTQDFSISDAQMEEMVRRIFGEEFINSEAGEEN
jgi:peptidyl-prolyl cis-trans isomerase C